MTIPEINANTLHRLRCLARGPRNIGTLVRDVLAERQLQGIREWDYEAIVRDIWQELEWDQLDGWVRVMTHEGQRVYELTERGREKIND